MSNAIEILTNKFIQDVKNLWELERQRVSKKEVERNLMERQDVNMIVKEEANLKKPKKVKKVIIDDDPILPNEHQYNPVTKKIDRNELIHQDNVVFDWLKRGGINIHGSPNSRYIRLHIDKNRLDYIADHDGRIKPEGYYYFKDLEFWRDDIIDELEIWFKTADVSQKFASKDDKPVSDFGYEKLLRKRQLRHILLDDNPVIPKKKQGDVKVGDFIFRYNRSGTSKTVFGKVVRFTDKFTEILEYVDHSYSIYNYDDKQMNSWTTFDMELPYTSKSKIPKGKDMLIITDEKGFIINDAHFRGWGYKS